MLNKRLGAALQLLAAIGFLGSVHMHAAEIIQGDSPEGSGQTFTFATQAHVSTPQGEFFYVGAQTNANNSEFAVSALTQRDNKMVPLAPKLVWLNNTQDQPNPLFNEGIKFLGLLAPADTSSAMFRDPVFVPFAVTTSDLTSVYAIDTFFRDRKAVLSVVGVKDASGTMTTSGIVGLGNMADVIAVAAVKSNAGGNFGAAGSGLAMLRLDTEKEEKDCLVTTNRVLKQVDAPDSDPVGLQTRALPLDVTTAAVNIGSDLAAMNDNAVFHWDNRLTRLYVGLQVTAGAGANDGARAVVIVSPTESGKFVVQTIAPDAVFANQDEIIGAVGANVQVSTHGLKTMCTSTALDYLIVHGGNGTPSTTMRTVYALPLVNTKGANAAHGTIANKNAMINVFAGTFTDPATTNAQMTKTGDTAALVGGGALAVGDITDMFVRGDTVFVTVKTADANHAPGIFYSQALFDDTQKITRWTTWQRVGGSTDSVLGATIDPLYNVVTIAGTNGNTIKRTAWGTGDNNGLLGGTLTDASKGLVSLVGAELPQETAGVQGLFNFPCITPGLNNKISLLIFTGLKKIVLAETGVNNGTSLIPNVGDFAKDKETFTNGTITHDLPAPATTPRLLSISGGVLDDLGPITCAEIGVDDMSKQQQAWFFVGGTGGLAVLAKPDGSGWDPTVGLGPNFAGLTNGMAFKKVDTYSFIRALVADEHMLYVLTDKVLQAIDLSASDFSTGVLSIRTLATLSSSIGLEKCDTFTDLIVSGRFALLATSKGLLRVGNGSNILTAATMDDVAWAPVPLPQSVGPVTKLIPITTSGRAQNFARAGGGNVYILNAYVGYHQAQIARFNSKDLSAMAVDDMSLLEIQNFIMMVGNIAPIIYFNHFRDFALNDGATLFNGIDRDVIQDPFVLSTPGIKRGVTQVVLGSTRIPLALESSSHIADMLRNSASGSWLVAGDFGLRVNE